MTFSPFLTTNRTDARRLGFFKAGATSYYTVPGVNFTGTGTANGVLNTVYYWPFIVETPMVIDQMAAEVTTLAAATNFRIGAYAADVNWQPISAPLLDSGAISSATTGVKTYTPTTPVLFAAGRYLLAFNTDSSTPAFRKFVGWCREPMIRDTITATPYPAFLAGSQTFGAFPTPGTAWTTTTFIGSMAEYYACFRVSGP